MSFYGVKPPIASPYVKSSGGKHRGRLDRGAEIALPEARTVRAVEGVKHACICTKVDV